MSWTKSTQDTIICRRHNHVNSGTFFESSRLSLARNFSVTVALTVEIKIAPKWIEKKDQIYNLHSFVPHGSEALDGFNLWCSWCTHTFFFFRICAKRNLLVSYVVFNWRRNVLNLGRLVLFSFFFTFVWNCALRWYLNQMHNSVNTGKNVNTHSFQKLYKTVHMYGWILIIVKLNAWAQTWFPLRRVVGTFQICQLSIKT